jgi:glycosyltransferase involved in cell wall biosynthesis
MNILLVVHQFFPDFFAGTEVLTLGVARELRARGHTVRILSGHPGAPDCAYADRRETYRYDDFDVYRFHHAYVPMGGQTSMLEVGADNHLAARYLRDILAGFRADRIHYFHLNRLGTGLILEAERAGVPQSFTPTDFWTVCPTAQLRLPDGRTCDGPSRHAGNCAVHFAQDRLHPRWQTLVGRMPTALADCAVRTAVAVRARAPAPLRELRAMGERLPKTIDRLNRLDRILAPNAFMRDKLTAYGVDPLRIVQIPYGIDLPAQGHADTPSPVAGAPLRIGFIGTLASHKGAHVLLDAFSRITPGLASVRIYGAAHEFPDYAAQLRKAAAAQPGAELAGAFAPAEIFRVLAALDVLVVPSLWFENTPLVVYSAQAAGLPVVASNFPGLASAVRDGVDGLLFPPGDAQALARQLSRLAESPQLGAQLRAQVRPPKSTATYVTELLRAWQA